MWSGAAGMGVVEVTQTRSGRWEFLVELCVFFVRVCPTCRMPIAVDGAGLALQTS